MSQQSEDDGTALPIFLIYKEACVADHDGQESGLDEMGPMKEERELPQSLKIGDIIYLQCSLKVQGKLYKGIAQGKFKILGSGLTST